jgi:hypothetical protein
MSDDDAELVALIDNELDQGRRTALLARLADDGLRQRYGELWQTSAPLAASFDGSARASSARSFADRPSR